MNSVANVNVDKESLGILQAYPAKATVSELYDAHDDLRSALISIFGEAFEYPDFAHRTMGQVVKMAEKKMGLGVVPVAPLFDPLSVDGYAQVMANPKLQLARQDELDSFFSGRIVDVRNSLRDLGWVGEPRSFTLAKDDLCVGFDSVQVGAGRNVVGGKWQLAQVGNPGFAQAQGDKVAVVDDLRLDAVAMAGEIEAIFVREKSRISENLKLQPQELSLSEFSEIAKIQKLENHGRKWSVSFAGTDLGFADSPSRLDVFREVHGREVNNALYSHSADAPDFLKGAAFPSSTALADHPDLVKKFSDVFKGREVALAVADVSEKSQYLKKILESESGDFDKVYGIFKKSYGSSHEQDVTESDVEFVKRCAEQDFMDVGAGGAIFQEVADSLSTAKYAPKTIGPAFTAGQKFDFQVGEDVVANGFRGTMVKVCDGQLDGMVEVRLPGGVACMSASYPDCFPAVNNGVETVVAGRFSGKVKEVTNQFVVQDVGRGRLVAHETHRFNNLPIVGDKISLSHRAGKVDFMVEVAKSKSLGR